MTKLRTAPLRRALPLAAALLAGTAAAAGAQTSRVEYDISFPNAVHHEARVQAVFTGTPAHERLQVRMSRSSPGRYALHGFAKNVYDVSATDGAGRPLAVTRPDPYGWDVAPSPDHVVRFTYTLFGDRADGTYAGIDATHAHLNMPATFAWARGFEDVPIRVRFARQPGWSVATQLLPTPDSSVFTAPNLQYFLDSPTEVGPLSWRQWEMRGTDGRPVTVRIAMHHQGTEAELDAFTEMTKKVTAEQAAVFGGVASDHGTYTFLVDYLPWVNGDGMEHRNSTVVSSTRPLSTSARDNLGTMSHEFFHLWNVERIRPASLEPFDFERANMSGELWLAEGFTSYMDDLFIRRAGLYSDAEYAQIAGGIVNAVTVAPGKHFHSPVEMAQQAPFVDAAASIDPQNRVNTFISYYTIGAAVGLGLDLELRRRGRTLDDYFHALWVEFGQEQRPELAPVRGYTVPDLERVLGRVAGDRPFATEFFRRHVYGRELPDFGPLLAQAGFLLRPAAPGTAWVGPVRDEEGHVAVVGQTLIGSPLYEAGLDRGDRIVSLDGAPVASAEAFARAANGALGRAMEIVYEQRGRTVRRSITFTPDPSVEVVPFEAAGRAMTPAQQAFRARWLGSRVAR
jgi:predicted metalloprotease with PDZ domain